MKKTTDLEMAFLSHEYNEFVKKEEIQTGVLNTRNLNSKNVSVRSMIKVWMSLKKYRGDVS